MKYLDTYKKLKLNDEEEVFEYLLNNLKPSNTLWSYFVNWEKVVTNTRKLEVSLNILNYLIGKDDFDNEFKALIKEHNEVARVIPNLLVRNGKDKKKFKILVDYSNKKLVYEDFDFTKENLNEEDIEKCLTFVKETGLKEMLVNKDIKNLVDYMTGVEAGLDSNARKNRGGNAMEDIVEAFVQDIADKRGCSYLKEANARKIKDEFGVDVPVDKSSRRYDFVINCGGQLYIIETNYYGGGGSKLKSTAGEYKDLHNTLNGEFPFIWITDGKGWEAASLPLSEAHSNNDYILSLKMLEESILDEIII